MDFKEVLPRIEEKIIIQETEAIESGKAIAIKREKLEAWMPLPTPWEGDRNESNRRR